MSQEIEPTEEPQERFFRKDYCPPDGGAANAPPPGDYDPWNPTRHLDAPVVCQPALATPSHPRPGQRISDEQIRAWFETGMSPPVIFRCNAQTELLAAEQAERSLPPPGSAESPLLAAQIVARNEHTSSERAERAREHRNNATILLCLAVTTEVECAGDDPLEQRKVHTTAPLNLMAVTGLAAVLRDKLVHDIRSLLDDTVDPRPLAGRTEERKRELAAGEQRLEYAIRELVELGPLFVAAAQRALRQPTAAEAIARTRAQLLQNANLTVPESLHTRPPDSQPDLRWLEEPE